MEPNWGAVATMVAGVIALLGAVLIGRRPRPLRAEPPPESVELAATADERERQIDAREAAAEEEWAEERRLAAALRAEADAVDETSADDVAALMNGGRS